MNYDRKLSRIIKVANNNDLITLRDAAKFIENRFRGVIRDAALEHAIEQLMLAAKTGKRADIAEATKQMEIVLRGHRLIGD